MSATANINVRVDAVLKEKAEQLFSDLGMNMTTAITVFLKTAVNCDGIPFEIRRHTPNEETRAALAEYEEMRRNDGKYRRYDNFDTLSDDTLSP